MVPHEAMEREIKDCEEREVGAGSLNLPLQSFLGLKYPIRRS